MDQNNNSEDVSLPINQKSKYKEKITISKKLFAVFAIFTALLGSMIWLLVENQNLKNELSIVSSKPMEANDYLEAKNQENNQIGIQFNTIEKTIGNLKIFAEYPVYSYNSTAELSEITITENGIETDQSKQLVHLLKSVLSKDVSDFIIDLTKNEIYLMKGNFEIYDGFFKVERVTYKSDQYDTILTISSIESLFTKQLDTFERGKILEYIPKTNSLLLVFGSGDGCGGNTVIRNINTITKKVTTSTTFGSGCADGDRFGGLYQNKIIGATIERDENFDYFLAQNEGPITSLYLWDPVTDLKTTLGINQSQLSEIDSLINNTREQNLYGEKINLSEIKDKILLYKVNALENEPLTESNTPVFEFNLKTNKLETVSIPSLFYSSSSTL